MKGYYNLHLFRPGRSLERQIFLIGLRNQFIGGDHVDVPLCQGKAYAWELLGQIAESTPPNGTDWSRWNWQEPGTPQASHFSEGIVEYDKQTDTKTSLDFETFEMIHLNPTAAQHAIRRMMATKVRKRANDLGWRTFEEFPPNSSEVKTIWRRIPKNGCIALGVWDDLNGSTMPGIYSDDKWKRHVLVYDSPQGSAGGACDQAASPTVGSDPRIRAQDQFVWMRVSATTLTDRFKDPADPTHTNKPAVNNLLILVGMHIARKDVPDWAWVTTWWKSKDMDPSPQEVVGRDQVFPTSSVWSNYILNYALSFQFPCLGPGCAQDHRTFVYNPYLEAANLPNGTSSNCIACHAKARYVQKGDAGGDYFRVPSPFGSDLMLFRFEGTTMTDYSWTAGNK
jgi:hypothetical protein